MEESKRRRERKRVKGRQRVTKVKRKGVMGKVGEGGGNGYLKEKGRGHIVLVLMHAWLSVSGHGPVSLITS